MAAPHCTIHSRRQAGCRVCNAWIADYNRRRRAALKAGTWAPMVHRDTVRPHIRALQAAGMRLRDIAERAGISRGHLNTILYTDAHPRLTPAVADAILGVTAVAAPRWLIDATGTRRRLQALSASGWPYSAIAARLGRDHSAVQIWSTRTLITRGTAEKVDALYQELREIPGPSHLCRLRATRRGIPTCDDWDGVDIDDPQATPNPPPVGDPDDIDEVAVARVVTAPAWLPTPPLLNQAEKDAAIVLALRRGVPKKTIVTRVHVSHERITAVHERVTAVQEGT